MATRFPANKTRVIFRLPCLLIELFNIGMPLVRMDGRAGARSRDNKSLPQLKIVKKTVNTFEFIDGLLTGAHESHCF